MSIKLLYLVLALILSPILIGIINKVKAFFGGRKGQSVLQLYYDISKLFKKGAVYSNSVSWIFPLTPIINLASLITALMLIPFPGCEGALISFKGDVILFVYLLALGRFVTVLASLDTASSFEGMGASREVIYSAIAEPAFFIALSVLVCKTSGFSLSDISQSMLHADWTKNTAVLVLLFIALFIIMLSENCRVPFDDPNTHLELTMIHEVMILDYSGPDLGILLYASSLKLFVFASVIVLFIIPSFTSIPILNYIIYLFEIVIVIMIVGITESIFARADFLKVPMMLLFATALSLVSLILMLRF